MFYSKIFKLCGWLIVLSLVVWKIYIFLAQDSCLDSGNVWDYDEGRCRDDCLRWDKVHGCIKMNDEQVALFKKCRYQPAGCVPRRVFDDICLNNNLAVNKITGECNMDFTDDQCHKLGDDWLYPSICH